MKILKNFLFLFLALNMAQESRTMVPASEPLALSLRINLISDHAEVRSQIFLPEIPINPLEWYPSIKKAHDFSYCLHRYARLLYANKTECIKENSRVFELITQGLIMRLIEALRESFSYALLVGHNEASEYLTGLELMLSHYDSSYSVALKQKLMPLLQMITYGIKQDIFDNLTYVNMCNAYVMNFLRETTPFKEYIKTRFAKAYLICSYISCLYKELIKIPLVEIQKFLEKPFMAPHPKGLSHAPPSPLKPPATVPYYKSPAAPMMAVPKAHLNLPVPGNRAQCGAPPPVPYRSAMQMPAFRPPAPVQRQSTIQSASPPVMGMARPTPPPVMSMTRPAPSPVMSMTRPPVGYPQMPAYPVPVSSPVPYRAQFTLYPEAPQAQTLPPYKDKWDAVTSIVKMLGSRAVIKREGFSKEELRDYLKNNFTLEQLQLLGDFFDFNTGRLVRTRLIRKNLVLAGGIYEFFGINLTNLTAEERTELLRILSLPSDEDFRSSIMAFHRNIEFHREAAGVVSPPAVALFPGFVAPVYAPASLALDLEKSEEKSLKRKRTQDEEDEFTCIICHEAFKSPLDIASLSCRCNMFYHHRCLEEWKEAKGVLQCTTCRKERLEIIDFDSQKK